jgi:hypothetical protein
MKIVKNKITHTHTLYVSMFQKTKQKQNTTKLTMEAIA